jgi:hypothetical protein
MVQALTRRVEPSDDPGDGTGTQGGRAASRAAGVINLGYLGPTRMGG